MAESKTSRRATSASSLKKSASTASGPGKSAKGKPARAPKTAYSKAEIEEIFARFEARDPEPRGELHYVNPYTLLVAVVLSAQATDVGVNKATRGLFAAASTPQAMLALGEETVRDYIKTIGLYRNKAKNVIALSAALIKDYGGEVPRDREALQALPGVGRKTANVVLNIAFGEPTIAVDTHIFRIANRIKLAPGKTPDAVEAHLEKIIPEAYKRHAHHWLILHGRYVCKARKPDCEACLIVDLCKSSEKVFPA
ncbi:endonuclease III [Amorphus sp. 3PC139-8]|uniref:endonuclease III n=1 Tax=Amorphus sp. 3PC139-8 TaxID=2735676 RepID=UPI00345DC03D